MFNPNNWGLIKNKVKENVMNGKGRVTIPTDMDVIEGTKELAKKWGADAVRDCDGTDFPEELKDEGLKVYSTYYTTRKDNAWLRQIRMKFSSSM